MPTSWTKTETPAATWAEKSGIGSTWPGDWQILQGYAWPELQQFTWEQLSGANTWTLATVPATSWTVTE